MANEQDGPPPTVTDERVKAWLKNQEKDPEAQADSKAVATIPASVPGVTSPWILCRAASTSSSR